MSRLMRHAVEATGIALTLATNSDHPKPGEFYHVPRDALPMPGGVIKVLAKTKADITKLYATLHEQAIQVGQDMVRVQVVNDLMDLAAETGNDPRARV